MTGRQRLHSAVRFGRRALFGDRVGVVLFLASLCLFVTLWRTAFLINDSYTLANGLYAVARGDVMMTEAAYGPLRSPGATLNGGDVYSRNYGVLVLSLPLVYGLRLLDLVTDMRVALVALWSLLLFAAIVAAGRFSDRSRLVTSVGGVLVTVLFALNVWLARPFEQIPIHLLALQLFHMIAGAMLIVLVYRLAARRYDRRIAVLTALLVLLGTPLAFWASVPKRHVVTTAVAFGVAIALTDRRSADGDWAFESRAVGYLLIALLAWIHAPEALVMLVVFAPVDLWTAPDNGRRTLGTLAAVFAVALLPLFVTNTLLSGDPFTVPRMHPSVGELSDIAFDRSSGSGGSSDGGSQLPLFVVVALSIVRSALNPLETLFGLFQRGLVVSVTQPSDVFHTFVRSGFVQQVAERSGDAPAANLSLLESAPVLASAAAVVPTLRTALRRDDRWHTLRRSVAPSDLFLLLFGVSLTLVYISNLPLHAQVTVRYLFPTMPLLVYLIVRLPPVNSMLARHLRTVLWSGGAGVLIGGQFVLVALVALDVGRAEAFQFHAVLALAIAAPLAAWSVVTTLDDRLDRLGAVLFGLSTAATTIFVCFAAVEYYGLGHSHALPIVRVVAETLPLD